ncbi:MAG: copper resistance protein B [Sphingomonas bacterium]
MALCGVTCIGPGATGNFTCTPSAGTHWIRIGALVRWEFASYIGVSWQRRIGRTADLARAVGERAGGAGFVLGARAWF